MTRTQDRVLTSNCAEGRHDVCRCELPGQDKKFAGKLIWPGIGGWEIVGNCECPCHEGTA